MNNKKNIFIILLVCIAATPLLSKADGDLLANKQPWSYTYTCPQGFHVKGYGQQGQQSVKLLGSKKTDVECELDAGYVTNLGGSPNVIVSDYDSFPEKRYNNLTFRPWCAVFFSCPDISFSPDKPMFEVREFGTDRPLVLGDLWIKFNNYGVASNSKGLKVAGGKVMVSVDVEANNGCAPPDTAMDSEQFFDYVGTTLFHPTVSFGSYRRTFGTHCTENINASISDAYLPYLSLNKLQARCDLMPDRVTWAAGVLDVIADQNAGHHMAQRNFRKQLWIKISCTEDYVPNKRVVKTEVAEYEYNCFDYGDDYFIIGTNNRSVIRDNPAGVLRCIQGEQESLAAGKG